MRQKKAISIHILFLCLLTASNSSGSMVICTSSDGHIMFESAFHQHCNEPAFHEHSLTSETESDESPDIERSHCEPCVDIPVNISLADNKHLSKESKPHSLVFTSSLESITIPNNTFQSTAALNFSPAAATHSDHLSTVILLV